MKKYIFIFLCFPFLLVAQNESQLKKNLFKINILNPGFTFETGVTNNTSLCLDANLSFGFAIHNNKSTFLASPFLRGQYRYYYNLEKRITKGKSISNNSGGFLAFNASYYFKPFGNTLYISDYDGVTLGGVWGFQKSYKCGLNLTANTGLGYTMSSQQHDGVMPILNFTIGWLIGK